MNDGIELFQGNGINLVFITYSLREVMEFKLLKEKSAEQEWNSLFYASSFYSFIKVGL